MTSPRGIPLFPMSFILRDPFFDGFEDLMTNHWPIPLSRSRAKPVEDEKETSMTKAKRLRRDEITPYSGFGRMDLRENDKDYELSVDIPGMDKNDIKISTENNILRIEGERKEEKSSEKDKVHFMERHYGCFRREISLPSNVKADDIVAMYNNGVLKLHIPKAEAHSTKKSITVAYGCLLHTSSLQCFLSEDLKKTTIQMIHPISLNALPCYKTTK